MVPANAADTELWCQGINTAPFQRAFQICIRFGK